jgi:hypothetical protein
MINLDEYEADILQSVENGEWCTLSKYYSDAYTSICLK